MAHTSPTAATHAGDDLLNAANEVTTAPVAKQLAAFRAQHVKFLAAEAAVAKAAAAVGAQQASIADADVDQDASVNGLAAALIGAGGDRKQPFAKYDEEAPATLCRLGYGAEAKACLKLVARVRRGKPPEAVVNAALALEAASKKVQAELAPLPVLVEARTLAIGRRDTIAQEWQRALAVLRAAAVLSDKEDGTKLVATLFGDAGTAKRTAPKKKPAKKKPA